MIMLYIQCKACGLHTNIITEKEQANKSVHVCDVCKVIESKEDYMTKDCDVN